MFSLESFADPVAGLSAFNLGGKKIIEQNVGLDIEAREGKGA